MHKYGVVVGRRSWILAFCSFFVMQNCICVNFLYINIYYQSFRYDVYRNAPLILEAYYAVGETLDASNKIRQAFS